MKRKEIGKLGESLVCRKLISKGCKFVAKNWCCVGGEIDLILKYKEKILFVEVKTTSGLDFGFPEEKFTHYKRRSLRRAISSFIREMHIPYDKCRVDLACCYLERRPKVFYYTNVLEITNFR